MPLYEFECSACQQRETRRRPLEQRNFPDICSACTGKMKRVFAADIQLNTRPSLLEDGNKFAHGFSETERTATLKRHDALYEANHKNG